MARRVSSTLDSTPLSALVKPLERIHRVIYGLDFRTAELLYDPHLSAEQRLALAAGVVMHARSDALVADLRAAARALEKALAATDAEAWLRRQLDGLDGDGA